MDICYYGKGNVVFDTNAYCITYQDYLKYYVLSQIPTSNNNSLLNTALLPQSNSLMPNNSLDPSLIIIPTSPYMDEFEKQLAENARKQLLEEQTAANMKKMEEEWYNNFVNCSDDDKKKILDEIALKKYGTNNITWDYNLQTTQDNNKQTTTSTSQNKKTNTTTSNNKNVPETAVNNYTYNKKLARSQSFNHIFIDEEDYNHIITISKAAKYYFTEKELENCKTNLNWSENAHYIDENLSLIKTMKDEQKKLEIRIQTSVDLLKGCDNELMSTLESTLVSSIFCTTPNASEKIPWNSIEGTINTIINSAIETLEDEYNRTYEYAISLWDFSAYQGDNHPDAVSDEDTDLVRRAMLELGSTKVSTYSRSLKLWANSGNFTDYILKNLNMNNGLSNYQKSLNKLFDAPTNFNGLYYEKFSECLASDHMKDTASGKIFALYTDSLSSMDAIRENIAKLKSVQSKVPYLAYTFEDDYKSTYKDVLNTKNADNSMDTSALAKKYGVDQSVFEYMTPSEATMYIYLKNSDIAEKNYNFLLHAWNNNTHIEGVNNWNQVEAAKYYQPEKEYFESLYKTTLKNRQAEYEAYESVQRLLNDGQITLDEHIINAGNGFFDGLAQYFLDISRCNPASWDQGKTKDELKNEKIAKILLSFSLKNDSKKDEVLDSYKLSYDYGLISEDNYKAMKNVHDFVSKGKSSYNELTAYCAEYSYSKDFGKTLTIGVVKALGKALDSYAPGVGALFDGLNALQSAGSSSFKEFQKSGSYEAAIAAGTFGLLNSLVINKAAGNYGKEAASLFKDSTAKLMASTFTREMIKSTAKSFENYVTDRITNPNAGIDFHLKFMDSMNTFFNETLPAYKKGELNDADFIKGIVDVAMPYAMSLGVKGIHFDGKGGASAMVSQGVDQVALFATWLDTFTGSESGTPIVNYDNEGV